ncbi:glycosyltransferase family 2 protein [Qipengyuania gelatinilytica]|uniref:Glycosyltransferase family 2 protein n=1 Tax=Qipengyuania gelatinilytica TaxID=2867231 RepID=A0ABX9A752_9SPHN|nr:glycosyltransferase family 2 protein [Qipengyuania gelatinilytica]QZD95743.1 glycosyltransferase family 2 protein [Qipengyuania gelatinilytica]
MPETARTLVSVLVPAFNEEDNVERAYKAIVNTFERLPDYDYEIIFTDNHSTDRTFAILEGLARQDPRLKVIRFSRNFGYQRSLLCGYKAATGACSIQLDCDLQDPPSLIPEMLKLWRMDHQVVYGIRRSLPDGFVVRQLRRGFYRLISKISDDDLPINVGEYRLCDRRILDELHKVEDTTPYLRGLISSMGFSQIGIEYDRADRVAGESKFPFRSMVSLAVDGLLNHSLLPLRLASFAGITVGLISMIVSFVYILGRVFFGQAWPAGFATTTILLLMSISINAIFMGILGEYIGRLFIQSRTDADPIIETRLNFREPPRPPHLREIRNGG